MRHTDATSRRHPLHGTWRVLRYNAHWYVAAAATCVAAFIAVGLAEAAWLRLLLAGLGALASWWLAASILGSYWIYDRARLNEWSWLERHISPPREGNRWLSLDAGSDLGTEALEELLPGEIGQRRTLPIPAAGRTRSLNAAQADMPSTSGPVGLEPPGERVFDRVLLLQAAHEFRQRADRARLFRDVAAALVPAGELTVVEHGLDLPNLLLWGPGAFHHFPASEWIELAEEAGLRLHHAGRHTPFVRVLVFRAPAPSA